MRIDPVTLEVIRNALLAVAEEMGVGLQKSAYSSNIKTRLDFACAIFDSSLRNIAQALHIPSMLGALVTAVPAAVTDYGAVNLSPGDGLVMNDPHKGGTHLPDISLITPVFHDSEIFCYVANIAHHQDVGGRSPGSVPGNTTEIYQEGLIIPPMKLLERWEVRGGILKLLLANVRSPRERVGDYRAQVAANSLGVRRLRDLIKRYGVEVLQAHMEEILAYTERRMRSAIGEIAEGVYRGEDYLDGDGVTREPVKIAADVFVKDGEVTVDLSASDGQGPGPMNATMAPTLSAVSYILKCVADPSIPVNDGMYRPLHIIVHEGSVVNAKHPAAIAGCWEVGQRVCDALMIALSKAVPDKVCAAGKGVICNISFGGIDPRDGSLYAFYETVGGGYGGRPAKDGMDAVQYHLTNTQNAPVEELELRYPLLIEGYQLIPDSEGPGKHRGGLGIRRDYRFIDHTATFSILSDRRRFPPWGLFGGLEARSSRYLVNPSSESPRELWSKETIRLNPGDLVSVQTPGGGGYGDPLERDPSLVLVDVRNEKMSPERARRFYGVVIDPTLWRVDLGETQRIRRAFAGERGGGR